MHYLRLFLKKKISIQYNIGANNPLKNITIVKKICEILDIYFKRNLNNSFALQISYVGSDQNSNEGFYGLALRDDYYTMKQALIKEQGANPIIGVQLSTTGKKVEKRLVNSNQILKTWNTIAKAAESEGFSTAKMSRSVKDKTVIQDYYYCLA